MNKDGSHTQVNQCDYIKKRKDKIHMIISISAEKTQYPFVLKTHTKVGVVGTYLNIIKAIYDKFTANVILW